MDRKLRAAIAGVPEENWMPIRYPRTIWDGQRRAWVSDAEVAETRYAAFARKKDPAVTAGLIIWRVRGLNDKGAAGPHESFPVWRYHPVFAGSPFDLIQARTRW